MAILRRKQVEARTGMATSTLYRWMAEGSFPKPVRIGPNAVGWPESEIDAWIEARIAERDQQGAA